MASNREPKLPLRHLGGICYRGSLCSEPSNCFSTKRRNMPHAKNPNYNIDVDPAKQGLEPEWRQIVQSATDMAIITTNPSGLVTSWNRGALRLLGRLRKSATMGMEFVQALASDRASRTREPADMCRSSAPVLEGCNGYENGI